MPYSDLIVKSSYTIADTGQSITIQDNTGTYPASPGGFAPVPDGTPTRPEEGHVLIWFIYRYMLPDGTWEEIIPLTQQVGPATFSLLNDDGEAEDRIYQFIELVVSDSLNWGADVIEEGLDFNQIISLGQAGGAIGVTPVWANINSTNCRNDARFRLVNAWLAGSCDTTEYRAINAFYQAIVAGVGIVYPIPINTNPSTVIYQGMEQMLIELTKICNDPDCKCNC